MLYAHLLISSRGSVWLHRPYPFDFTILKALITLGDIINNDQSNGDFFGNLRITIEGQSKTPNVASC